MYDQNHKPARTQMSHYLRTGRVLPVEHFQSHKSNPSAYSEDEFLSHKSWTTYDFWKHYKTGNGKPIDLAHVGLLDSFQNSRSVRRAVDNFKDRQIKLAKQKSVQVCRKLKGEYPTIQYVAFSDRNNTTTDVTMDILRLFSVGGSTFYRSARSVLDVNCGKRTIRLEGILNFSIDDAFIDAKDIPNWIDGNQEFDGGVPYKIKASWSKKIFWRGKF